MGINAPTGPEADQAVEPKNESVQLAQGELSPEQIAFINKLESRFRLNIDRIPDLDKIQWSEVEARLSTRPEILESLQSMEADGMEPHLTGQINGSFIFDELVRRVPDRSPRREVSAEEAMSYVAQAGEGIELTQPDRYKTLINDFGIELDVHDMTWLNPNQFHPTEEGLVPCGFLGNGGAVIQERESDYKDSLTVFRCSLVC